MDDLVQREGSVAVEAVRAGRTALLEAWRASLSPATRAAYLADIADFAVHTGARDAASACERPLAAGKIAAEQQVLDYLRHLAEERKLSPATVARRRAALRSVVQMANGLALVSWTLTAPQPPSVRPRSYRDVRGPGLAVVRQLREVAAAQRGVKAARDVALVGLLYSLGLRRAEVCSLDVEDFDRAARRLAVVGKGHSDADRLTVPVALAAELEAYLEQRSAPPVGPLFASADRARKGDGRLTPSGLAKLLRHLAGRAGAAVPVSPHRLRHSAVTDALEASRGDVRRVRVFARHAKIDTTLRYDDVRRDVGGEIAVMLSGALGSPRQAERDQEKEDCFDGDVPENASSREQKTDEE